MQMIRIFAFCLFALALTASKVSAAPIFIDDPGQYAADAMGHMVKGDTATVAKMVSDSVGKPESAESIKNSLAVFSGKPIDYNDKVIDNTFGKGLRQIVYYCFVENIGFVYFRFNYKMSSHGWILANFNFKTETNELFPRDFVNLKG